MILNTAALSGNKLLAIDGQLGSIYDFYFDDQTWDIRYLVADTGDWLPGKLVLLAPPSFGSYFEEREEFCINLLRQQIEDSPDRDKHKPVSRQFEDEYSRHYGWLSHVGDGLTSPLAYPVYEPPSDAQLKRWAEEHSHEDPHLRSTRHLIGYNIQAVDGEIGTVSGFLIKQHDWQIHGITVECGHWYAGKEVIIPTKYVKSISYAESKIYVSLTTREIEQTAEDHAVTPLPLHI